MFRKHFKGWGATDMQKTGLFGYVYAFSVDYDAVNFLDIVSMHKYLLMKYNIK